MNEITLPQGKIRYREAGTGAPIVLVHGLLVDGELWREVIPRLARDFRVIAPDWPLGSQELPLEDGADLSPPALARLIADFLAALELEDVTLVGNDSGGALCQLVAVEHPERLGRLVLTPCDAYENFPPPAFRPLQAVSRVPGALAAIGQLMRLPAARRTPLAFGWVSKRADDALTGSWFAASRRDPRVRRQMGEFLRGMRSGYTQAAAQRFGEFTKPVLVAWAPEDRFFKLAYGERLAAAFPNARLELIEDSYAFVSLDQPERTAQLIADFAREPVAAAG
jgi:pimeloyl-ACP methyl ester carboxylesterase